MRRLLAAALVAACAAATGCDSPEARRSLGGGRGADVGNRAAVVKMHEGSQPYWKVHGMAGQQDNIAASQQAQQLSRK
jgi:hypothetical protein